MCALNNTSIKSDIKVGTFNCTGMAYIGHFDVWLTNQEQSLLEQTRYLMPDSPTLSGWVNGDLYTVTGETVGILPIPQLTRTAADIQSYTSSSLTENKMKHSFLAWRQGTKYAVISVHTTEEKTIFKAGPTPDWKKCVLLWNQSANGRTIFYKVCCSLYIICSKLMMLWQLVEHLQAYYAKWKWNVNEKNSVAQVVAKIG